MVGAIGQPDAEKGELPCAYVQLNDGENSTPGELISFVKIKLLRWPPYQNILRL